MRRRRGKAAAMRRFASRKFAFQPPMQLISIQFNFTQQASAANILLQKKNVKLIFQLDKANFLQEDSRLSKFLERLQT